MSIDIYEKIRDGEYEPKLPYPTKPHRPTPFMKRVIDCSEKELQNVGQLKAQYAKELEAYEEQRRLYYKEEGRLQQQFYCDVCEEAGLQHSHPFVQKLYARAWSEGHSSGLGDVYCIFQDLTELWEIAVTHGMNREVVA